MKSFKMLVLIWIFIIFGASIAGEAPTVINDATPLQPLSRISSMDQSLVDIIGVNDFYTHKATADWQGSSSLLSFYTNFPQGGLSSHVPADLALDLNRDGSYGIAVRPSGLSFGQDQSGPNWALSSQNYADGSWNYGGRFRQDLKNAFTQTNGAQTIGTAPLNPASFINTPNGRYGWDVALPGMASLMQNYDSAWGRSDQGANDFVISTTTAVPDSPALWLLNCGLLGLISSRKWLFTG
jgi:hypothetical protein